VKAGLVVREPSSTDRRVKLVVVTRAGEKLYAKVQAEGAAVRHELLAGLDSAQLRIATELMERLLTMIEASA